MGEPTRDLLPPKIPSVPDLSISYDKLSLGEPIGGGGNADVMTAEYPISDGDMTVAVKEPRLSGTLHADQAERMINEAETWDKLDDHDHIVKVLDYGSSPIPWIAMEHMDGGHLGQQESISLEQAFWTAISITRGVRHAHRRGVAHLDIKPENVLFTTIEDAWAVPKVADWGLSKHLLHHSNSMEGVSPQYAAPEQFDESYGETDLSTDIYQLGATLYRLFTGEPPFEGSPTKVMRAVMDDAPTSPSQIADVPKSLDDVLLTAMAKEKENRYDDIVYLRDDIQDIFDNLNGKTTVGSQNTASVGTSNPTLPDSKQKTSSADPSNADKISTSNISRDNNHQSKKSKNPIGEGEYISIEVVGFANEEIECLDRDGEDTFEDKKYTAIAMIIENKTDYEWFFYAIDNLSLISSEGFSYDRLQNNGWTDYEGQLTPWHNIFTHDIDANSKSRTVAFYETWFEPKRVEYTRKVSKAHGNNKEDGKERITVNIDESIREDLRGLPENLPIDSICLN